MSISRAIVAEIYDYIVLAPTWLIWGITILAMSIIAFFAFDTSISRAIVEKLDDYIVLAPIWLIGGIAILATSIITFFVMGVMFTMPIWLVLVAIGAEQKYINAVWIVGAIVAYSLTLLEYDKQKLREGH